MKLYSGLMIAVAVSLTACGSVSIKRTNEVPFVAGGMDRSLECATEAMRSSGLTMNGGHMKGQDQVTGTFVEGGILPKMYIATAVGDSTKKVIQFKLENHASDAVIGKLTNDDEALGKKLDEILANFKKCRS